VTSIYCAFCPSSFLQLSPTHVFGITFLLEKAMQRRPGKSVNMRAGDELLV
jgi:hypothetical protein